MKATATKKNKLSKSIASYATLRADAKKARQDCADLNELCRELRNERDATMAHLIERTTALNNIANHDMKRLNGELFKARCIIARQKIVMAKVIPALADAALEPVYMMQPGKGIAFEVSNGWPKSFDETDEDVVDRDEQTRPGHEL